MTKLKGLFYFLYNDNPKTILLHSLTTMRRSARLDRSLPKNRVVITQLIAMMDRVHRGKNKKERFKSTLEVVNYVILHFNAIKQEYKNLTGQQSFASFAKTVYHKIQEFIHIGRESLQAGEKVKRCLSQFLYYQRLYEKIYFEYEEQNILETRLKTLTRLMEKKQVVSNRNCQEMKKHIKKFLVNQLPLCYDVIEIIKSYCFYDVKTFALLRFVKEVKFHMVTLIDSAEHSRKNGMNQADDEDPDEIEHWSFCIDNYEASFQGVNCRFCGNYWGQYLPMWAPHNIVCNCEEI